MTSLDNRPIEIATYTNPCSDRMEDDVDISIFIDFLAGEENARSEARIGNFFDGFKRGKEESGIFFQRKYPSRLTESPEISKWHDTITKWMPSGVEDWLEQFENDKHLDPMPREWWRLRTRELFVAHESGDRNRHLGYLALTKVYAHERSGSTIAPYSPLLFEPRGLFVRESHRGQGIAEKLVRAAVHAAAMSEERLATGAVTTNPVAAKLFQRTGAVNRPATTKQFQYNDYEAVMCWARLEEKDGPQYCESCPIAYHTSWWWPTHRDPITEIETPEAGL